LLTVIVVKLGAFTVKVNLLGFIDWLLVKKVSMEMWREKQVWDLNDQHHYSTTMVFGRATKETNKDIKKCRK